MGLKNDNSIDALIIKEDDLKGLMNNYNLTPIRVFPNAKLSVQLACSEDVFLQIAASKSSELFYYYEYPEDYEIIITGRTFEEANGELSRLIQFLGIDEDFYWYIDEDIYPELYNENEEKGDHVFTALEKKLKKQILANNATINKEDYFIPRRFMAFYIDNGCLVGIYKEASKPYFSLAETSLFSLLSEHKEIIEKNMEAAEQHKNEVRDKVKEYLINDIQFKISTNQDLRADYAYNLWNNTKFKWIHEGFKERRGGYPPKEYFNFIERVFREMKYSGTKITEQTN